MKQLKVFTFLVYSAVGGIVLSFGMSVYIAAVQNHHAETHPAPLTIPLPSSQ